MVGFAGSSAEMAAGFCVAFFCLAGVCALGLSDCVTGSLWGCDGGSLPQGDAHQG